MNVKSGITIVASSAFVPTKARNCGSRRCRKPQFLLVGVAPQTPFSAPWPGLAARSIPERYCFCSAETGRPCRPLAKQKTAVLPLAAVIE